MESDKTSYNHTLDSHKHYFAGFLNLAQNNIYAIFHLFCQRFGINYSSESEIINNEFTDKTAISEYQKKMDFLKQYFPVIHYLEVINNKTNNENNKNSESDQQKVRKNFTTLIKAIDDLRNFYTHHYHQPITFDKDFFELLDELFVIVVHDVKKHRMKGEQTRYLVKEKLQSEFKELVKAKKEDLETLKREGKRVNLDPEAIKNGVFNDAFYHLLYKKNSVNNRYKSELTSEEKTAKNNSNTAGEDKAEKKLNISESGLLFLLSMFLQKDENEQLRANIKGYKAKVIVNKENGIENKENINRNNNSLKFMATHWVFNHLSVKRIRHRLNTRFQKETLLLQIADELSKVPDELYQTFTKEKKEEFIEDMNEYVKDSNKSESLDKSTVIHPVIRKRYEDKFNYFALRFLDEFVKFPSLRFQIYLGNFVHDRKKKLILGTNYNTERVIKEKINVFGKLSEIYECKSDFFISLKNKEESTQWEEFPNPSYNFVGNNVLIYLDPKSLELNKKEERGLLYQLINLRQKTNRKENKPTKTDIVNQLNENIIFSQPTALLSLNEMPALLYEILKNNETGEGIENTLFEKLIDRIKNIKHFDPSKTPIISTSQITKKLRKSTHEEKINFDKLSRAIENEIQITQEKLSLIKRNETEFCNKKRKIIFTKKELGQQATWLADDIKRYMPKKTKENWKGYQHSHLQQLLAFYEYKQGELRTYLEEYSLNDNNICLKTSLTKNTFHEFYRTYLSKRKKYFEYLKVQINGFKENDKKILNKFLNQHIWSIFYKRLYKIPTTKDQKEQLLLKPLVFPRGIFDENPTYIKGIHIKDNPNLYADWYKFIQEENHELQKFYAWERDYKELFEQHKHTGEFVNNQNCLSEDQKFDLFKKKWDKKIKKIIGQDLFLKLMMEKIIKDLYDQEVNLSLSNFYLTRQERIEKEQKAQEQNKKEKGNKSKNIIKDDFIWSMMIPFKYRFTDTQDKDKYTIDELIKLKDIGTFVGLLNDKRVISIFEYDADEKWTRSEIEKELESYETIRRKEIFKLFQKLEKTILDVLYPDRKDHPKCLEKNNSPNFNKYIKALLNKYPEIDEEKSEKNKQTSSMLIYLRNKFAHNQLPTKEYYDIITQETKNSEPKPTTVAENILNYLEKNIGRIENQIKAH